MRADRSTNLGKIGLGMARIASLFAFAGSLLVLMLGVLNRPISLRNLLVGLVCGASLTAVTDRKWGRMLAALGLFTGAFVAALDQHGRTRSVAMEEQWFAWLSFALGAAVLGGHALHLWSGAPVRPDDGPGPAPTPLPPDQDTAPAVSPRRRKWLILSLCITCCCGAPFVWLPFTLLGGRQVTRLHERLRPSMSAADVLGRVDEVSLWSLGLSQVFLSPQVDANTRSGTSDSGDACPVGMPLVWSHGSGAPWGQGMNPRREDVAKRLARCDKVEFRLVVLFSRFHFFVTLKDGRVQEVSPVEGEFE